MDVPEILKVFVKENEGIIGIVLGLIGTVFTIWGFLIGMRRFNEPQSKTPSALADIFAHKVIRVGVINVPPTVTVIQNGEEIDADGIFPRLLKYIAEKEHLKIEWVPVSWSDIFEAVRTRKVHLVPSIYLTNKRAEHATFCSKILRVKITGVVRADETRILTHDDLRKPDIRIGIIRFESGWEYAVDRLNLAFEWKRFRVLDLAELTVLTELLETSVVDVVLAGGINCDNAVRLANKTKSKLKMIFVEKPLETWDCSIMIGRDDFELRDWLDRWVRKIRSLPELAELETRDLADFVDVVEKRNP